MGAWIETLTTAPTELPATVAPLVGAWIETTSYDYERKRSVSLPSWERGLKQHLFLSCLWSKMSLPSWERGLKQLLKLDLYTKVSRSPRGSVD